MPDKPLSNIDLFKRIKAAVFEFDQTGSVTTARCDQCGQIINIRRLTVNSLEVSCVCGRCNKTLNGI